MIKRLCADAMLAAGTLGLGAADALAHAIATPELSVTLTPYLWLPMIDGTVNDHLLRGIGGSAGVDLNPSNYLSGLNFDRPSVSTDIMDVSLSSSSGHLKQRALS